MKGPRRTFFSLCLVAASACVERSIVHTAFEQSYLRAQHNWALRDRFPRADRLLNAFDYGHAALYQALLLPRDAAPRRVGQEFEFITTRLLPDPPGLPLDETAIGPDFAKLAPELVAMFDWAHVLHRQLYDVWSAPGLTDQQRDTDVVRVLKYYRSRTDLALSTRPKSMQLMEGQPYSLAFRRQNPKYNGLLWAYHWFQLALYDALIAGRTQSALQTGVDSTIARFFRLLDDAPTHMPTEMPTSPSASPKFAERYPEAAIVFDNLHALHDVVSDILTSPAVTRAAKRSRLLAAAAAYRDSTTAIVSLDEWRHMSHMRP